MTLFFLLNPKQFDIGGITSAITGYKRRKHKEEESIEVQNPELEERIENFAEISPKVTKLRQKITESAFDLEKFENLRAKFQKLAEAQLKLAQLILLLDEEEKALIAFLMTEDD